MFWFQRCVFFSTPQINNLFFCSPKVSHVRITSTSRSESCGCVICCFLLCCFVKAATWPETAAQPLRERLVKGSRKSEYILSLVLGFHFFCHCSGTRAAFSTTSWKTRGKTARHIHVRKLARRLAPTFSSPLLDLERKLPAALKKSNNTQAKKNSRRV